MMNNIIYPVSVRKVTMRQYVNKWVEQKLSHEQILQALEALNIPVSIESKCRALHFGGSNPQHIIAMLFAKNYSLEDISKGLIGIKGLTKNTVNELIESFNK